MSDYIAEWNGIDWSAIDGSIYIGGAFVNTGNAQWDNGRQVWECQWCGNRWAEQWRYKCPDCGGPRLED